MSDSAATVETAGSDVDGDAVDTIESLVAVEPAHCRTELYLDDNGTIRMHVGNRGTNVDVTFWLDQARALHDALGHLLWLAEHRD